ncbi:MAG: hypothetical protein KBC02_01160 [Candidatus Pacebacteria bacterium]|nr:hypothetical protein [Candidatus Paceibacterota bacterium]
MDFWQVHGLGFLIAIAFFPRLTMLFAGIASGFGPLGWLGFVFAPHLTVAILATTAYWGTNPGLCVLAWIVALTGTAGETTTTRTVVTGYKQPSRSPLPTPHRVGLL